MSNYLMHYASKYYDPVAAKEYNHQYYEEHKKLKGRQPAKEDPVSLTESQVETVRTELDKLKQRLSGNTVSEEEKTEAKNRIAQQISSARSSISSRQQQISKESSEPEYSSKWYTPRKSSNPLSGLNSEGRAVAREIKTSINKQRDEDVESAREEMNKNISDLKDKIEEVKTLSGDEKEAKRDEITSEIERLKDEAAKRREEIETALGLKADETEEAIERRTKQAKSDADAVRAQIKALGNSESAKRRKALLQEKLSEITEDREEDNASLRKSLKSDRKTASAEKKEVSDNLRESTSVLRNNLKSFIKENTKTRNTKVSNLKKEIDTFRENTKQKIKDIKSEAEKTYLSEVENLKGYSRYLSKKKS